MSRSSRGEGLRAVDAAVTRLNDASSGERLRLYRLHLQVSVIWTSPLAIDLATYAGTDLSRVAAMFRVPRRWPPGAPPAAASQRDRNVASSLGRSRTHARILPTTSPLFGLGGVTLQGRPRSPAELCFIPRQAVLEAVLRIGATVLRTDRGGGHVVVAGAIPQTLLLGMIGRSLESVVSHSVLDGRGYVVEEAFFDAFVGGSVVRFRTGVPLALPWADDLAGLVSAARFEAASVLASDPGTVVARYDRQGQRLSASVGEAPRDWVDYVAQKRVW